VQLISPTFLVTACGEYAASNGPTIPPVADEPVTAGVVDSMPRQTWARPPGQPMEQGSSFQMWKISGRELGHPLRLQGCLDLQHETQG
jgi:hypothetical protein